MASKGKMDKGEIILFSTFLIIVVTVITIVSTGLPYTLIESGRMSFWIMILMPLGVITAGIIFTYSLAQYTLDGQFRNLVLVLMAINMILDAFLYVLTNTAFTNLSPFADRDRNRTIVTAFSLIVGPTVLFGSLTDHNEATQKQKYITLLWGLVIVPSISLWFFLSPEPVFITTPIGAGLSGFTPIAWIALLGVPVALVIALGKYIQAWRKERKLIDLSTAVALMIWLLSVGVFATQTHPLQWIELVWYGTFISGLAIIAIVTISSSVIEPQRELTVLVENRTKQLVEAREESEFYLNLWGHKIGNLLQSMILYLEMVSSEEKTREELSVLAYTALDIGWETNLINRQVAALLEMKKGKESDMFPVELFRVLQASLTDFAEIQGDDRSMKTIVIPESTTSVMADEFLDLVFTNVFTYLWKLSENPHISIQTEETQNTVKLTIQSKGDEVPDMVNSYFLPSFRPERTTLNLELFTVRLLMSRYKGTVEYLREESEEKNIFIITFDRASPIGDNPRTT